ncbi:MAG: SDR family oxidoreductase [Erysipelotrichaceae bacterium]|nr:SDR family oxidoreductase [Erysipelotrichaceae bacterium]
MKDGRYIGVDGCRGGWIAAVLDQGKLHPQRFASLEELIDHYPEFDAFLIDMAVGLVDDQTKHRPEAAARKELKGRSSALFPIPCRQAVYVQGEAAQKETNKAVLGKSLPKQTLNILPKIREVDLFLEEHPRYRERILESHPELDFQRLKGGSLLYKKKDPEGLQERVKILQEYLPDLSLSFSEQKAKELHCQTDDLLDALCLSVTAALYAEGYCETIPEVPEKDERGLDMKLTVPVKKKVAVVTGGAHGIGKCIADAFRRQYVRVYVIDKTEGDHYVGDIADKSTLEDFVQEVLKENDGIDYLINNAPPLMKGIGECSYEEFQYALSVGVTAPFYLAELFAPYFREGSSIINISSSRDRMSQPQTESYTAAKGGIRALTHALAMSFAGRVRVNSVSPGWIDVEGTDYEGPDVLQQPAGRVGKPEDIAELVLFLCSEKAGFITGENICVDGGMTRQMIYHGDHGWNYIPQ